MGYRYEIQVQGKWYDNQVVLATEAEAQGAGDTKLFSWSLAESVRVVETDKPVNYKFMIDRGLIHIEGSEE
jgi:hypothetical protein